MQQEHPRIHYSCYAIVYILNKHWFPYNPCVHSDHKQIIQACDLWSWFTVEAEWSLISWSDAQLGWLLHQNETPGSDLSPAEWQLNDRKINNWVRSVKIVHWCLLSHVIWLQATKTSLCWDWRGFSVSSLRVSPRCVKSKAAHKLTDHCTNALKHDQKWHKSTGNGFTDRWASHTHLERWPLTFRFRTAVTVQRRGRGIFPYPLARRSHAGAKKMMLVLVVRCSQDRGKGCRV